MMKRILLLLPVLLAALNAQAAFTEFYCIHGGTNINSGDTTNLTASYTSTNGNWNGSTTFIPADGVNPVSAGVVTNTFASVYIDGATNGVYLARILTVTNAVNGGIILSTNASSGTAPTSNATARSIKVGGAWNGPYGSVGFPFALASGFLTNSAGDIPRINFNGNSTNIITASITHSLGGSIVFQGYTNAPGDGGFAHIADTNTASSYILLQLNGTAAIISDFTFTAAFSAGAQVGCYLNGNTLTGHRLIAHDLVASGIQLAASVCVECEAYNCNTLTNANSGGFNLVSAGSLLERCYAHDNTGAGVNISAANSTLIKDCVISANANGVRVSNGNNIGPRVISTDIYNNTASGILLSSATNGSPLFAENVNFLHNGGTAIDCNGALSFKAGYILNCGFGSGTQTNGLDLTAGHHFIVVGSVTYGANVTPWVDPANRDFRINLTAAKGAGLGTFARGATNTVAYPDIGAAQHIDTPATGGGSYPFVQ